MTKRARQALLKSIEHWHQNLDILIMNYLSKQQLTTDISTSGLDCALCAEYSSCFGCPVCLKTNATQCIGTPYKTVSDWIFYNVPFLQNYNTYYKQGYEAISDELEFLYRLLEE